MLEPAPELIFYTAFALLGGSLVGALTVVVVRYRGVKTRRVGRAAAIVVGLIAAAGVTTVLWARPATVSLDGLTNSDEGDQTCSFDSVSTAFAAIDRIGDRPPRCRLGDWFLRREIAQKCVWSSRVRVVAGGVVWAVALGGCYAKMRSRDEPGPWWWQP